MATAAAFENRAAFRKVNAAAFVWDAWLERDAQLGVDDIVDCGNNALAEIAVRLGCSKTMAENFATVGMDLRLRLPLVREVFAAGMLDYARVSKICRATCGFRQATVDAAVRDIVAAAASLSPGPLGAAIDQILTRIAPEEVAERRIEATRFRKLRKRRDGDLGVSKR
ncbi:DUF222 domain-containing protein [Antrihabitans cavernicola]|nr:DUF222 domain-containing protein [Spelaeibacter cavernicola]